MNEMQKDTVRYIVRGLAYIAFCIAAGIALGYAVTAHACDGEPVYPETVEAPTIILSSF